MSWRTSRTRSRAWSAAVVETGTVDHSCDVGLGRGALALAARARCRIEHAPFEVDTAKAPLRVANGLALGMRARVAALDHAARSFADDRAVDDEDGAVRLVAPRLGEAPHR